jgi:hypothetical protein
MLVNPQLVRLILLTVESASYPLKGRIGAIHVDGYDQLAINEHIEELRKADALKVVVKRSRARAGGPIVAAEVKHLTDTGWRLVDMVKKNESWSRVTKAIGTQQVSMPELVQILHRES